MAVGCRLEYDKTIPKSSPYSIGFTIRVSAEKCKCLHRNTLNTIQALGNLPIIATAKKETVLTQAINSTRLTNSHTVKLGPVAYDLKSHSYNYAITKPGHPDFACLQFYANQFRLPMLVCLRLVYPSGSIKHHIIGIVPVAIGNRIHMHIVKGCHPEKKSVPLNEVNLIWCSSECKSCSVDQLVAFVPGENTAKKLKDHTSELNNEMYSKLLTFEKHYQNQLDQFHLNLERERFYKTMKKHCFNRFHLDLKEEE
jgi:hypothetical protein